MLFRSAITRKPGVRYSVLTPNLKGFEAAIAAPRAQWPDEIVVFGAASEAFSQKNINCSIAESIERFAPVVAAAHAAGVKVRGAISCTLGCPYQGEVPIESVVDCVQRFADLGCDDIGIADTIGVGTPARTAAVFEAAARAYPLAQISGHFHDTYGMAIANICAALALGVATFDTSIAGLGGCPYAQGASGNVATEDVVYLLDGLGIQTGVVLATLLEASAFTAQILQRPPQSKVARALLARAKSPTA